MTRRQAVLFAIPFFLVGIPAHAYGDPTGGTFFQVLLPMLAAVWAMFLIFANRIRRAFSKLFARFRGVKPEEQKRQDTQDQPLSSD